MCVSVSVRYTKRARVSQSIEWHGKHRDERWMELCSLCFQPDLQLIFHEWMNEWRHRCVSVYMLSTMQNARFQKSFTWRLTTAVFVFHAPAAFNGALFASKTFYHSERPLSHTHFFHAFCFLETDAILNKFSLFSLFVSVCMSNVYIYEHWACCACWSIPAAYFHFKGHLKTRHRIFYGNSLKTKWTIW